ncbi:hypothetical protein EDEG_00906 [Edhazardia aedis USNM 41457]|uniref:PPPDE domain-containing protein n=1 Tax=Edhazardia aedis (strain USNM 41457) TaxID=1003232 RepID=J9DBX0_EDHAE|nr:hypothetical protein EDEG_00906 [Edhazardia aedis USNM 41457]|eukprot:EJW04989.1 hypothetical protein EDEG_00906 [Edhazardia aedis USNM 41457]
MEEKGHDIKLRIYDLVPGQEKQLLSLLVGMPIEYIYHTSIEVYGKEFWFGSEIFQSEPGKSGHGVPIEIKNMGQTFVDEETFLGYAFNDMKHKYDHGKYDLMHNNCNNFSNDMLMFLVGKGIPQHILELPDLVMKSPGFNVFMNNFIRKNEK